MKLIFFCPMEKVPTTTHQMKQVHVVRGKPFFYEPEEVVAVRRKLLDAVAGHRPETPMEGAVRLTVKWLFYSKHHDHGTYRTTKPDTDNLQKMLKDVMTACGFWQDDAQVASEICEKFWVTELSGIFIQAEELKP